MTPRTALAVYWLWIGVMSVGLYVLAMVW